MERDDLSEPGYFAIIPATVRYDAGLSPNAKLMYGEISALCRREGYCWASNAYFAALYKSSERTARRWLAELAERGHVTLEGGDSKKRRIKLSLDVRVDPDRNVREPGQNCPHISTRKVQPPVVQLGWTRENGWSGVTEELRREWKEAYPACDIDRQLLAMQVWLKANPERAKKSNWLRFVRNWLTKEQDRGGDMRRSNYGNKERRGTPTGKRDHRASDVEDSAEGGGVGLPII
jgi:hypothetical protein